MGNVEGDVQIDAGVGNANQPGLRPEKQFVQTTFIHRDINDRDREYAQFVELELANLRLRLGQNAFLTLDNENIDCGREGNSWAHRCSEYPLDRHFHFLVIEDSRNGAGVYTLPVERNWAGEEGRAQTLGRVEMALLDALSRHSSHPLMGCASAQAERQLGFVRMLQNVELEAFIRQNHEKSLSQGGERKQQRAELSPFFIQIRSPTEMRLLNERILRNRRPDFTFDHSRSLLRHFRGPELAEAIESPEGQQTALFVLFWSDASWLGQHALQIWEKTAQTWKESEGGEVAMPMPDGGNGNGEKAGALGDARAGELLFGAVNCQQERELCRAFGVLHSQPAHEHLLLAYKDGHRLGQQLAMGDQQFLVEWIRLLLSGPLLQLTSAKQLEGAVESGVLDLPAQPSLFPPAFSIGRFRDEQQEEFRNYRRVATMLSGRYYLAYLLDPSVDTAQLTTFRRHAYGTTQPEQVPYTASFGVRSLLSHITHASMPTIADIGNGFTTDIAIQPALTLLLIYDSTRSDAWQLLKSFIDIGRKLREEKRHIVMLELDKSKALPLDSLMAELKLRVGGGGKADDLPALCLLNLQEICCALHPQVADLQSIEFDESIRRFGLEEIVLNNNTADKGDNYTCTVQFPHKVALNLTNGLHPLQQIQLQHIYRIFGGGLQQIDLKPEPISTLMNSNRPDPHSFVENLESIGSSSISGCPMMTHLNNLHDEL